MRQLVLNFSGKLVGGVLGLILGGPFGALIGLFAGHQFDRGVRERRSPYEGVGTATARIQAVFFTSTFSVMGHIAKSDGRVSEAEISAARRVMHRLGLGPAQVKEAIAAFTHGKGADFRLDAVLAELERLFSGRQELGSAFVEIQLEAAIGAGSFGQRQRQLVWEVAQALKITRVEMAQIEALVRAADYRGARSAEQAAGASLDAAYRVLGVTGDASDREVKTAYRRLMNQHHPDKLVARGLPESMQNAAKEKTREIRAAYDRIKAQRGM